MGVGDAQFGDRNLRRIGFSGDALQIARLDFLTFTRQLAARQHVSIGDGRYIRRDHVRHRIRHRLITRRSFVHFPRAIPGIFVHLALLRRVDRVLGVFQGLLKIPGFFVVGL